jgi:hypothetical protein
MLFTESAQKNRQSISRQQPSNWGQPSFWGSPGYVIPQTGTPPSSPY